MNTIILYITINAIAIFIGWLATESKLRIADQIPQLNFKPFNCRPCFTFHSIWILQVITAYIIGSWIYGIIGIITAFTIWFILWYQDRQHIE